MDVINAKLESNNPVYCCQVLHNVVELIIAKFPKRDRKTTKEMTEIKFLKEKCGSTNPSVNKTACEGILKLIDHGILEITPPFMTYFVSLSTHAPDVSGVMYLLYKLLLIETAKAEHVPYNLISPQHPFLSVIFQNAKEWRSIFEYVKNYYVKDRSSSDDKDIFQPLYLYIFFEPVVPQQFRLQLWTFLIKHQQKHKHLQYILYKQLRWIPFDSNLGVITITPMVIGLLEFEESKQTLNYQNIDFLLLYGTAVIRELCGQKLNPTEMICSLSEVVRKLYSGRELTTVNCMIYLLSYCISIMSVSHIPDLIQFCCVLVKLPNVNSIILHCLKSALLPWLVYPTFLPTTTVNIANEILNKEEVASNPTTTKMMQTPLHQMLKHSSEDLTIAVDVCVFSETVKSEEEILTFLKNLENIPMFLLNKLASFLTSILMMDYQNESIPLTALDLLLDYIKIFHKYSVNNVMTIVVYKLSRTTSTTLHYALLKSLATLMLQDENEQLVLNLVNAVGKGSVYLTTFAMTLHLDLWNVDKKFYHQLEQLLVMDVPEDCPDILEFQITKARVMKEICQKEPELYGKEMVAHLSKLLNNSAGKAGEIPSALALEGITHLCRSGVIDIATTWEALAPKFREDTRVLVVKSFCPLMATAACYTDLNRPKFDKILEDIVKLLWEYATKSNHLEIIDAALKALTAFELEKISEFFPVEYREENETSYIFNLIPGERWIKFLRLGNYAALDAMGDFLESLIKLEMSGLKKNTYEVTENRGEPTNYDYLPIQSVIKAVGNYLKRQVTQWNKMDKPIYLQCLRVFSKEYSKPLPPFEWNFLQELLHEQETRIYCIHILSHQVMLSGTARRLMENLLQALIEVHTNDEDILTIYKNFNYLCNSIQPMIMKPFIMKTMQWAISSENQENLKTILMHVEKVLIDPEINDANKSVISDIIATLVEKEDVEKLLPCICALPQKFVCDLSEPDKTAPKNIEVFKKCIQIRCAMAIKAKTQPLEWLNEILYCPDFIPEANDYVLEKIAAVFIHHRKHTDNMLWVIDLIWRVQAELTDSDQCSEHVIFMFDVFIFAVLHFSALVAFNAESPTTYFPEALKMLLKDDNWMDRAVRVIEWLHHIINLEFVPVMYKDVFMDSLICVRSEKYFKKSTQWLKYLNNDVFNDKYSESFNDIN